MGSPGPGPIYHVTGLIALLTQFVHVGATVYLHRRFDARRLLECVRDEGITYLHASPTAFEKVLALKDDFPSLPTLRALLSGSSYEPVGKMRAFHEWLPACAFQVVYGLTETASPALLFPFDSPTSIYAGATGKPVPGVDVRIVDEGGRDVEDGLVGEILLSGTCVTEGYYNCPARAVDDEGWLPTGDMGYADALGMVWVVDRKKDMINRGGEKVWCSCLEETIGSRECARHALRASPTSFTGGSCCGDRRRGGALASDGSSMPCGNAWQASKCRARGVRRLHPNRRRKPTALGWRVVIVQIRKA
ncbi:MAG: class I adenylate-forming enzyme family protein [Collinsella intestinalis]